MNNTILRTIVRAAAVSAIAIVLQACPGGGGSDDPFGLGEGLGGGSSLNAIFDFDGAVAGLEYVSGGVSGFTSNTGGFNFESGAPVEFFMGNQSLGTIYPSSGGSYSPIDLGSGATSWDSINIGRLILSGDANGNLGTIDLFSGLSGLTSSGINFNVDPSTFGSQSAVQGFIGELDGANSGYSVSLVSESESTTRLNNISGGGGTGSGACYGPVGIAGSTQQWCIDNYTAAACSSLSGQGGYGNMTFVSGGNCSSMGSWDCIVDGQTGSATCI